MSQHDTAQLIPIDADDETAFLRQLNLWASKEKELEASRETPRSPRIEEGIPFEPEVRNILRTQARLIQLAQQVLGLKPVDFSRLVLDVIIRFAAYVELLPASRQHHHCEAGGLFRHSLEVAIHAAQISTGTIMARKGSAEQRFIAKPRWMLAAFLAGLLHDIGKVQTCFEVYDQTNSVRWSPYSDTLWGWGMKNNVRRYLVRWNTDYAQEDHELWSCTLASEILTDRVKDYLRESTAEDITVALHDALSGRGGDDNPLTAILAKSDTKSVHYYNVEHGITTSAQGIMRIDQRVCFAVQELIKTGTFTINEAGSQIYMIGGRCYLSWNRLVIGEIRNYLAANRMPGIPNDRDVLAGLLLKDGIIVPNEYKAEDKGIEVTYRSPYFLVEREPLEGENSVRLECVKLRTSQSILFARPASIPGRIITPSAEDNGWKPSKTERLPQGAENETARPKSPQELVKPENLDVSGERREPGQFEDYVDEKRAAECEEALRESAPAAKHTTPLPDENPPSKTPSEANPAGSSSETAEFAAENSVKTTAGAPASPDVSAEPKRTLFGRITGWFRSVTKRTEKDKSLSSKENAFGFVKTYSQPQAQSVKTDPQSEPEIVKTYSYSEPASDKSAPSPEGTSERSRNDPKTDAAPTESSPSEEIVKTYSQTGTESTTSVSETDAESVKTVSQSESESVKTYSHAEPASGTSGSSPENAPERPRSDPNTDAAPPESSSGEEVVKTYSQSEPDRVKTYSQKDPQTAPVSSDADASVAVVAGEPAEKASQDVPAPSVPAEPADVSESALPSAPAASADIPQPEPVPKVRPADWQIYEPDTKSVNTDCLWWADFPRLAILGRLLVPIDFPETELSAKSRQRLERIAALLPAHFPPMPNDVFRNAMAGSKSIARSFVSHCLAYEKTLEALDQLVKHGGFIPADPMHFVSRILPLAVSVASWHRALHADAGRFITFERNRVVLHSVRAFCRQARLASEDGFVAELAAVIPCKVRRNSVNKDFEVTLDDPVSPLFFSYLAGHPVAVTEEAALAELYAVLNPYLPPESAYVMAYADNRTEGEPRPEDPEELPPSEAPAAAEPPAEVSSPEPPAGEESGQPAREPSSHPAPEPESEPAAPPLTTNNSSRSDAPIPETGRASKSRRNRRKSAKSPEAAETNDVILEIVRQLREARGRWMTSKIEFTDDARSVSLHILDGIAKEKNIPNLRQLVVSRLQKGFDPVPGLSVVMKPRMMIVLKEPKKESVN